MNHSLFAALGAIAVAGTITVTAQTPTPSPTRPQTPTPSPSSSSRSDDKTMTLTGCLKSGDSSTDGGRSTPGTPSGATSSTASKFILTDIEGDSMGSGTAGSPGTAGRTGTTSTSGKQYTLKADSGVNLSAHLNHKVRVIGKLSDMDDQSPATTPPAEPTARPGDPAQPASTPGSPARPGGTATGDRMGMDKGQTLTVSAVTMISSSCASTR